MMKNHEKQRKNHEFYPDSQVSIGTFSSAVAASDVATVAPPGVAAPTSEPG
jgi:hypothetical protein